MSKKNLNDWPQTQANLDKLSNQDLWDIISYTDYYRDYETDEQLREFFGDMLDIDVNSLPKRTRLSVDDALFRQLF